MLDNDTIHRVEKGLETLTLHCQTLLNTLDTEAQALADLNIPAVEALCEEKSKTLDALAASEAKLRALLIPTAIDLGLPLKGLLSQEPFGEKIRLRQDRLKDLQQQLAQKNEQVRVRASHGIAFCRSVLGSTTTYGSQGVSRQNTPDLTHFHQVH